MPATLRALLVGFRQARTWLRRREIDDEIDHDRRDMRHAAGCPGRAPRSARRARSGARHEPAVDRGERRPGRRRPARCASDRRRSAQAGERTCRCPMRRGSARPVRRPAPRWREASSRRSCRRQADREAGAEHHRRAAGLLAGPRAVLRPDAAVVGLDDLLGDRQAEARSSGRRILAVVAVGVEALEDALELVGADAGAVVLDDDLDEAVRRVARRCGRCRPCGRRSGRCRSGC